MLPVVFIVVVIIIIGFIAFSASKRQSGEDMGERKNNLPPH